VAFEMPESRQWREKLSRTVLRGERGRKAPDLPGVFQKMDEHLIAKIVLSGLILLFYFIVASVKKSFIKRFGDKHRYRIKRTAYINKFLGILLFIVMITSQSIIWGIDFHGVYIFASSFFALVGIAFFASWSILSNITSSVMLFFSFPFRIDDKIKILDSDNSVSGVIKDMTLLHILIEDENGNLVTYPNILALQKAIIKYENT
jgi:small-conductance mechanosensitive channel